MKKTTNATHTIAPVSTDSAINIFLTSHLVYLPISPIGKLHIFLPGSSAIPDNSQKWLETTQEQGYHTIGLMYPNSPNQGQGCNVITNPSTYLDIFCQEVFNGETPIINSPLTVIDYNNSIHNRIIKLLQYLISNFPTEGWNQFFDGTDVIWNKVTVSGHSQGGDHATFMGKYLDLEKVICFSSPRELCGNFYSSVFGSLPISKYRFFTSTNDLFIPQTQMITAMGVNIPYVDTYTITDQLQWHEYLVTSRTSGITNFHKSTLSDDSTPMTAGVPDFKPIWIKLLIN